MNLSTLKNKNIAFLGLGIENLALIKFFLRKKIDCQITICDFKNEKELGKKFSVLRTRKNIHWKLGKDANKNLSGFDLLFRSPGWPLFDKGLVEVKKMNVKIINPIEFFIELSPTKNIIGVTGTKGKGTTSSLIYHILKKGKKRVWLAGNIGVAPFDFFEKVRKNDWIVFELSSFQLEDMTISPKIAVMTNFFNEHLAPADPNNPNYHKNAKIYWQAKLNIAKYQKKTEYFIANSKLKKKIHNIKLASKIKFFEKSNLKSKLVGEHNKENIAAAVEVAKIVGIKEKVIVKSVKNFSGLEHRIELVGNVKGVAYYNDSFATTPESTIIALKSFSQPIILLAGGAEKNSNFKELAKVINKKVNFLVLFKGDATLRMKKEVEKVRFDKKKIKVVNSMKEAVATARKNAKLGDVVLMSPACASFGMFKNYKERGKLFKQEVLKLK
ncbi:MAG: UDP-N-acetylmuramoylalanine--D-glutamate ligase [Parcubacteria group bacterium ADurb.Bin316]|nr:MAG: UDP-N-acetylmuramoylalanine--D-glutamate ligase [Parcubacteria group bacterium ADurb.Bin316]HOZ55676.1 UDP-N-acetylmuramoyl-L-alanine--D-glutamate ligase [bacterium]